MYELVVFDWDGTLMDSQARIVASANAAAEDMGAGRLPAEQIRNIIGLGLREAVQTLFPGCDDAFCDHYVERYRHYFLHADDTPMPLFEGVEQSLEVLRQAGFVLGVATGKSRAGLERALNETGLGPQFAATRCADETRSKPDPQMLHELMDQIAVAPARTLMVGDSEYDLQMARNAGVDSIAVSYGVHARERLLEFAPLVCVDSIAELVMWLQSPPVVQERK